jgi:hypothetical protein
MNKYLSGWGKGLRANQIRMDLNGALGVIIGFTVEAIMLQRSERQVEFIPMSDFDEFYQTTFSLGQLDDGTTNQTAGDKDE